MNHIGFNHTEVIGDLDKRIGVAWWNGFMREQGEEVWGDSIIGSLDGGVLPRQEIKWWLEGKWGQDRF